MSAELLWEALRSEGRKGVAAANPITTPVLTREPKRKQCAATTRSGRRCKGMARLGEDFCPFHNPNLTAEQRREIASRGGRSRRRLSHLPDGYLRRLQTPAAVAEAMDRLYREVRLGLVEPAMGRTLLDILTRLYDRLSSRPEARTPSAAGPSKVDDLRPKVDQALSRAELAAWQEVGIEPQGIVAKDANSQRLRHPAVAPPAESRREAVKPLVQIIRANAS